MDKSPDAFRSIGEVSNLVGVAPHVLRYWETQFSQLSPVKRGDGRRYYRPDDVRLVAGLCQIMREDGLSIRGAKRMISADRGAAVRRIGAERLGEAQGESAAPVATITPEPPPPAPRRSPEKSLQSLPLFAEPVAHQPQSWFERLCATSRALRDLENNKATLPAPAAALRERLNSAL
ncbi:MerR family transcriptional regulator [Paracoccus aestuariivivens]|uniref:MerR family transcriptional regulator n=1 Tax=Paracoccus aestuariivivens TaxID=1820333 RepID=A0A6L6J5J5_9RHOB|nr:MerR family transcriptional regulator [Paracoccus aestuariivivens]MTH77383.1 MerR family transcriptional regulator [Paracoccus aestuariivivens]